MTSAISCHAHDYFEIICIRRSQVLVTTNNNKKYQGTAVDIRTIENNELLQLETPKIDHLVLLTDISKLQAVGNKIEQHNFSVEWSLF